MMHTRRWNAALACLTILACGRSDTVAGGNPGGTVIIASGADADAILPPLVRTAVGKMIQDQIFEPLAEIGDNLNTAGDAGFTPVLAQRWTWSADSGSIAFSMDPNAKWQDGRPVRAQDVKFSFALLTDPAVGAMVASSLTHVDSISLSDSMTAVAWFKRRSPEQFFNLVYNLRVMPEHRLGVLSRDQLAASSEATHPIGSGPFRFVRWERNATIELEADTTAWRGRPLLDRVILSVSPDPTAAMTRVLAGEADFIEVLRGDAIQRIKDNPHATAINYPSYNFGFVQWNLRDPANEARPHPILGDRGVRRALAMGVDRASIISSVLDTLGTVSQGPYVLAQSFADSTIKALAYDQNAAKALLDSLGWKVANSNGFREKNGRPLELTLVVPVSSTARRSMSVILQDQLKALGAELKLDLVEPTVHGERVFNTRKWDGNFMGTLLDPGPGNVAQTWGSKNAVRGGSNVSRYVNHEFDAHVDSAETAYDMAARRAHFRRAFDILNSDAPSIWMYEVRNAAGIHKRIRPATLRPDAWWAHLDRWSIPADLRIARDKVGLGK
jgi:peptide/nickel transport system substrate-binding protein